MHIKEIAQRLNITPRTIRFYEEKGLIAPLKNEENQYRVFTEKEAWRLQTIVSLREVGMPIEQIRQVLEKIDQGAPEEILDYLELQRAVLFKEWVRLKQIIHTLDDMIQSYDPENSWSWENLWELANQCKRVESERDNWMDRWNFDKQAATYDEKIRAQQFGLYIHKDYDQVLDQVVHMIQPKQDEVGLEIGIGTGNLAGRFLQRGIEIKGIDQSKEMLKQCKRKHPEIETRIGNFLAIPYPDHRFDFVVTSYALHHLTDDQKLLALEEMKRVLKPEGRICIADLMFVDEKARMDYLEQWRKRGREDIIAQIEDEFYADRSRLLAWFHQEGAKVQTKQMNELVHLVYVELG
ncbi:MerR family transcriptional regulator [Thermoflavimicrobium dichotomicum]|uniref:Putative AdoMet-dependent methyltransferase n=1 Tax=Thermoflavimicrobium dichotomicum TaxID=46223 RepID=A0A1I3RJU2_9BACL|nr:MerR family transcriptional regulator [Thermoflavimicrobium dichotomicum]SFJ46508.1 putative AdoMet-dependent methyltransferase [Thermoflavimicrobium dichotomicum]